MFSGDYLDTDRGVNNVTGGYHPIHDHSEQTHDFAYLEKIIDPNNKISFMAGEFNAQFQIPNNPGQAAFGGISAINSAPISAFNSANLNEHQTEGAQFGAVSFLHSEGPLDYQVSLISKYATHHPDQSGDLAFSRISETAEKAHQLGERFAGRGQLPAQQRPHAARGHPAGRRTCDVGHQRECAGADRRRRGRQPDFRDRDDEHRR